MPRYARLVTSEVYAEPSFLLGVEGEELLDFFAVEAETEAQLVLPLVLLVVLLSHNSNMFWKCLL